MSADKKMTAFMAVLEDDESSYDAVFIENRITGEKTTVVDYGLFKKLDHSDVNGKEALSVGDLVYRYNLEVMRFTDIARNIDLKEHGLNRRRTVLMETVRTLYALLRMKEYDSGGNECDYEFVNNTVYGSYVADIDGLVVLASPDGYIDRVAFVRRMVDVGYSPKNSRWLYKLLIDFQRTISASNHYPELTKEWVYSKSSVKNPSTLETTVIYKLTMDVELYGSYRALPVAQGSSYCKSPDSDNPELGMVLAEARAGRRLMKVLEIIDTTRRIKCW